MVARGGGEGGGGEGGCAREAGRVWRTRRTKPYSHSILYRTPSVRPYGITRIITQNHKSDAGCRIEDAGRMQAVCAPSPEAAGARVEAVRPGCAARSRSPLARPAGAACIYVSLCAGWVRAPAGRAPWAAGCARAPSHARPSQSPLLATVRVRVRVRDRGKLRA